MKYTRYQILEAFCIAMEWAPDLERVYQNLVDVSVEYLDCDAAHLHLLDIDGVSFQHSAYHDDAFDASYYSDSLTKSVGRLASLIENRDLIIMDNYERPHAEDVIPEESLKAGFRSGVSIPLYSSTGVLGILSLVYKRSLPWKKVQHDFLLQLGNILGIFIQRIQMQKKDLELQMLRERKQLSTEIHDNVSQMISALAIRIDIAQECLIDNDAQGVASQLDELGIQARKITKILRDEMLSLRITVDSGEDLSSSINDILQRFREQWDIDVELQTAYEAPPRISSYAMLQLVRIVNEALQNVLRHARATLVKVVISRRNGHVVIKIADNGIGFDPDAVAPERLGLRIMRERAESADGALYVESDSGGTTITLELPVSRI